jgi:hypothetical protein
MAGEDYRSGFRSSGGFVPPTSGGAITNHEMNTVAYVPNVGFVAFHDSQPVECVSQDGRVWGPWGTQRVMGEIPLFVNGGTVWGVDTQVTTYEKIVAGDVASYPEFINQKLGVTRLTDAVNCWASSGKEIILLEQGGQVTCIPIDPASDPAPAGTPSAPLNVTALAKNMRAIITFSAPSSTGTSPITGYSFQYSSNNGATWTAATSFGAGTGEAYSKTLTALDNGTTYVFRVAAVNTSGTGAWSQVTIPVTPNVTVPSAPYNLTAMPTNWVVSSGSTGGGYNTAYALSWSPPTGTGGAAITGYKIEMVIGSSGYLLGTTSTPATTVTVGIAAPAAIITTMRVGLVYSFRVSAINSAGTGPASAASAGVQLK